MLYDPKWEAPAETKPPAPSLTGFAAWLETKDPREKYNWFDGSRCAVGQYADSLGLKRSFMCRGSNGDGTGDIWGQLDWIAQNGKHSFGAVARRARRRLFWQRVRQAIFG